MAVWAAILPVLIAGDAREGAPAVQIDFGLFPNPAYVVPQ
jgi:hypothetical protein